MVDNLDFVMTVQRIEGYDRLIMRWWWFLAILAALMIVLALWKGVVLLLVWWKKPRANPTRLFRQLCRMHELTKNEALLLRSLAKKLPRGTQSSILFVDPLCWNWSQTDKGEQKLTLEKLYAKIFGFPPDRTCV
ncbi:MAG: hypothetical protein ABL921_00395 [Pirellula sp.]